MAGEVVPHIEWDARINWRIEFDAQDRELITSIEVHRAVESLWFGRGNANGYGGRHGSLDRLGAAGELAVWILYSKRYQQQLAWSLPIGATSGELKIAGDVGHFHVRATDHQTGHLIVRRGDPHGWYALAIGTDGNIILPGYFVHDGSLDEESPYWTNFGREGRPYVWGIPQTHLEVWP